MPKLYLTVIFLLLFLNISLKKVYADISPTITGQPTCDLCGWCNQATSPKPPTWDSCHSCLYDQYGNEASGSYYTVFGCISTQPQGFVKSILSVVFGMSGGIAFLAVLAGSAMVLTSGGDLERLKSGKDIIVSSIIGIMLIVFSVFLLHFVGYDVLRIPGFG